MKIVNVLILSSGSRTKLVNYFMDRKNGFDKVITTDCSIFAPTIYVSDKFYKVPRMKEPNYLESIISICQIEEIGLIIPLQEDELLIIAENRKMFEDMGILVAISDIEKIILCRDKYACSEYLLQHGISVIETYHEDEGDYCLHNYKEVVVKPRYGAGSINTMVIHNRDLLNAFIKHSEEEMIVQPYINGTEYGVDVYVDFISKEVTSVFVKEKVRMRAGETEKSVSVINDEIVNLVTSAARKMGLEGPLDFDVLEMEGNYYILEINPRFGGGYPHAYECGVNFPRCLQLNALGQSNEAKINAYIPDIKAMKYSEILIKEKINDNN